MAISAWSGFIYQKPSAPTSIHDTIFLDVDLDQGLTWSFYRQPGDDIDSSSPSHAIIIASEHAKLYRIIHETILVYCGKMGKVSVDELSEIYDQFMGWREDLPKVIQNVDGDYSAVPHALFLQ